MAGMLIIPGGIVRAESPGGHSIKFVRPARVGDRYKVTLKGWDHNKDQTTSINSGAVLAKTEHKILIELEARAEVESIDRESQPDRIAYSVERCFATENEEKRELLPPKSQVVALKTENGTQFIIDGKPAEPKLDGALRVIIFLADSASPTDDDLFGTGKKKRIGEQWSINKEKAVLAFKTLNIFARASEISGSAKLDGIRKEGHSDILEVSSIIGLFTSARNKTTKIEVQYRMLLPENPESPIVAQSMDLYIVNTRHVIGKTGATAIYETTMRSGYEARYSPATDSQSPTKIGNAGR